MKRIVISSAGRSHLLDVSRELQRQGFDVIFYSFTPYKNFKRYGLEKGGISLLIPMLPFIFLHRKVKKWWSTKMYYKLMDMLVSIQLPQCDILIAQSPVYTKTIKKAKKKYNAKILLDRGSSHVKIFDALAANYGGETHTDEYVKMEEKQYDLADFIVVGSSYNADGFKSLGYKDKIFINNYGVYLDSFRPTRLQDNPYDLIMVGRWSRRKGCNFLKEYLEKHPQRSLLHVGSIEDSNLIPQTNNFNHVDSVPEHRLADYYSMARAFVLLSRDEGLALVQAQAIACGLPLLITHNTGGEDFIKHLDDPKWIKVVEDFTQEAIEEGVEYVINLANTQQGVRSYISDIEKKISWEAYGVRYKQFIDSIV